MADPLKQIDDLLEELLQDDTQHAKVIGFMVDWLVDDVRWLDLSIKPADRKTLLEVAQRINRID